VKPRPTIFLSGVSHELASFRDAAEAEVQRKGCFPLNQSSFDTDYRTVEAMLVRRIEESDAVIHLVGFRFGAEPKERPAGVPRRSYTQMEFDIARRLKKPVYVFLTRSQAVRQPPDPDERAEDDEARALQLAHRSTFEGRDDLYHHFADAEELRRLVLAIPVVAAAELKVDVGRVDRYAPDLLVGRDDELTMLAEAWEKACRAERPRPNVITFVALGGEGKTSVVAHWLAGLAGRNWPGCDAAFAWSFYSQGSAEQSAASSDLFLAEALRFFGDAETAASPASAVDKGKRLARLVGERRALLILDGLEPLQYPPTSPLRGELKDHGMSALLKGLAARNDSLCVVTTRYSVPDLKAFWRSTAPETRLLRLSKDAGVQLLWRLGVRGTRKEAEALVEDVKGHALTLGLIGKYLKEAHGSDIRRRDRVTLREANSEELGGHAFHVMDAYCRWLEADGKGGPRALTILRLLGLFDRPASADCVAALRQPPAIPGLTEELAGRDETAFNLALSRLEEARLLTTNRDAAGVVLAIDAHPLLREYFACRLREERPEAFQAGHRRLYEHLCKTEEGENPTLEDLQPLYQAVAHGCLAGMQQACANLYYDRICRRAESYAVHKLGAFGAELGAVACFFDTPWTTVASSLSAPDQAWLVNEAAVRLRAVGRLAEAQAPLRAALGRVIELEDWKNAAIGGGSLSQLGCTLGDVAQAVEDARHAVTYADRSGDAFQRMARRTDQADPLHAAGRQAEAEALFREAEGMQAERQPEYPVVYSLQGFRFCDLLLAVPERAAWRSAPPPDTEAPLKDCREVERRATQTLEWVTSQNWLLDIALDHLSLGRAALFIWLLGHGKAGRTAEYLAAAVDGLRRAGQQDHLPRSLLTRAWSHRTQGADALAIADLDEAYEIAERGPMRLHLADIHLYRCRLFHSANPYPWAADIDGKPRGPKDDLAAARKLIEQCGYWRRREELEDAEADAKNWPDA
jgi:hypothetical protein